MGWSRHDEDSRADHYREQQKNDWRQGEPPLSVQRKPSTAQEIAALVKTVDLITGATLIEDFVRSEYERIRLDAVAAGAQS